MHKNLVFCITEGGHFAVYLGGSYKSDGAGVMLALTNGEFDGEVGHPSDWNRAWTVSEALTNEETEDILKIIAEYLRNKKSC